MGLEREIFVEEMRRWRNWSLEDSVVLQGGY